MGVVQKLTMEENSVYTHLLVSICNYACSKLVLYCINYYTCTQNYTMIQVAFLPKTRRDTWAVCFFYNVSSINVLNFLKITIRKEHNLIVYG